MASLSDERIRRLHGQFLDAAERFPDLRFAAVTVTKQPEWLVEDERWPMLPSKPGETHLGLSRRNWLEVLNKAPGAVFSPISTVWIRIDGEKWEGGFFSDGELLEDGQAQFARLQRAITEFERLASMAAGHFEMPPSPTPMVDFPLEAKAAHRWLETVVRMAFVPVEDRWGILVRAVPGDLFTASARTLEVLSPSRQAKMLSSDYLPDHTTSN